MIFNGKNIRAQYDKENREWLFSAIDILSALTKSDNYDQSRKNWNTIKTRNQLSSKCRQLRLEAPDGKKYNTDVLNRSGVLQLASILKSSLVNELVEFLDGFAIKAKQYILKHKNVDVLEIELNDIGEINKIGGILNAEHLPVGSFTNGKLNAANIKDWWKGRSIPASRERLKEFLDKFGMYFPGELLEKSLGLSLSDQYWICSVNEPVEWEKVNFFGNDFSEDVGEILFGKAEVKNIDKVNLKSPDNTSDGVLRKRWKIINGKRYLIKGGSDPYNQEPANEVLASLVCKRLSIPFVNYEITKIGGKPHSICEDFVDENTELVTAWHIKNIVPKNNEQNDYENFISKCAELGIKDVRKYLEQMIVLDFIIANVDRHYNNFGFVRDANTLEWIGFAPIYDSGTSMWCKMLEENINPTSDDIESKPFRNKHNKQIELVTDFSWVNISALDGIEQDYAKILRIQNDRNKRLCWALRKRIELLAKFIGAK